MYPSCKFKAVKAAVKHYASTLEDHERASVSKCLDILGFSMGNTLVSFQDQYYEYGGDADQDNRGLTIGGFESGFLSDLLASFLLDKLNFLFNDSIFHGLYRDDGIIIFNGNRSIGDLRG